MFVSHFVTLPVLPHPRDCRQAVQEQRHRLQGARPLHCGEVATRRRWPCLDLHLPDVGQWGRQRDQHDDETGPQAEDCRGTCLLQGDPDQGLRLGAQRQGPAGRTTGVKGRSKVKGLHLLYSHKVHYAHISNNLHQVCIFETFNMGTIAIC